MTHDEIDIVRVMILTTIFHLLSLFPTFQNLQDLFTDPKFLLCCRCCNMTSNRDYFSGKNEFYLIFEKKRMM